jgi:cupin fold WbuC family metalloprotein
MSAPNLRVESDEVLYTLDAVTKVGKDDIQSLKSRALGNVRERARLCTHLSVDDSVHEMLIVHTRGTYIPPHKHLGKSESFHIVEGRLDIVIFDDAGNVVEIVEMGEYASGATFFWRISESSYHSVIPRTDIVVFHETTKGPFKREDFVHAPWAPKEDEEAAVRRYIAQLEHAIGASQEQ